MQVKWDAYNRSLLPNFHVNEANANEVNVTFVSLKDSAARVRHQDMHYCPAAHSPLCLHIVVMNGGAQSGREEVDMGRCPGGYSGPRARQTAVAECGQLGLPLWIITLWVTDRWSSGFYFLIPDREVEHCPQWKDSSVTNLHKVLSLFVCTSSDLFYSITIDLLEWLTAIMKSVVTRHDTICA